VLVKLGATGTGATQYLGVVFLLTGAVVALVPATQIATARDEEASGRLVHVMAGPPSRRRWLAGRLGLAACAVAFMGVLAGAASWAGARSQGLEVSFADTLFAGVNIVPAALLALAVGGLVFAAAPRRAAAAVYVLVGGSLIVDLLGSLVEALKVLTRLSLFHYVALAPAQDVRWANLAGYLVLAALAAVAAIFVFERRDLSAD
jgi:ABC-2 type transport system permease protein